MERTVKIEDSLEERVKDATDEAKNLLLRYLRENPETENTPRLFNDLDYSGLFHEIVDSSVPIYTKEIEDTWYLYGNELEEAYENAGVGYNPRDNNGMAAIYFYIHQELAEWYRSNADDIFDEWQESKATTE